MEVLKFKSFDNNELPVFNTDIVKQPIWGTPKENNSNYLQDYLKSIISRLVKVDFLLGDSNFISKEGILKEVGNDYIVLEMLQSNDLLACDIYSIKFVQII
jgi:hypothetical protein